MKILYDQSKAVQEKRKIDTETPALNHQAKVHNAVLAIVLLLSAAAVIFGLVCAYDHIMVIWYGENSLSQLLCALYFVAYPMALVVPIVIYLEYSDGVLTAKQRYPAPVDFYIATQNKTILKSTITKTDSHEILGDDYIIELILEGADHTVSESAIFLINFHTTTRTDLDEITVNLDEKKVYIPFQA